MHPVFLVIVLNHVTIVVLICRSFLSRKWVEFSKAAIITSCLCYLHLRVFLCVVCDHVCAKGKRGRVIRF